MAVYNGDNTCYRPYFGPASLPAQYYSLIQGVGTSITVVTVEHRVLEEVLGIVRDAKRYIGGWTRKFYGFKE